MVRRVKFGRVLTGALLLAAVACGGGDDEDADARKPDTGVGANSIVPQTRDCEAFCARLGECGELLCNEDTHSTRYTGFGDALAIQCMIACNQSVLDMITADQWQCLFQKTCRQAIDYDDCHTGAASYRCY